MNYDETLKVYQRMKAVKTFDNIHIKRARGEISDSEFLRLLDKIQIQAEEVMLEGERKSG